VAIEKSTTFVCYQTHMWKIGTGNGWTTSTLPLNLTRGKYKMEVDIIDSPTGSIMVGFSKEGLDLRTKYVGQVENSWSYSVDGKKFTNGGYEGFGPTAKKGDKITIKFNYDSPIVRIYKNRGLFGYFHDIPFQNNDIRFCVSLRDICDHVKVCVTVK